MVQEKYEVQLSSQEKGQLRENDPAGQEFSPGNHPWRAFCSRLTRAGLPPKWPRLWTSRSARCSAPSGDMPRRGWTRCCIAAIRSTGPEAGRPGGAPPHRPGLQPSARGPGSLDVARPGGQDRGTGFGGVLVPRDGAAAPEKTRSSRGARKSGAFPR